MPEVSGRFSGPLLTARAVLSEVSGLRLRNVIKWRLLKSVCLFTCVCACVFVSACSCLRACVTVCMHVRGYICISKIVNSMINVFCAFLCAFTCYWS